VVGFHPMANREIGQFFLNFKSSVDCKFIRIQIKFKFYTIPTQKIKYKSTQQSK
jgi:hypothetical protein